MEGGRQIGEKRKFNSQNRIKFRHVISYSHILIHTLALDGGYKFLLFDFKSTHTHWHTWKYLLLVFKSTSGVCKTD